MLIAMFSILMSCQKDDLEEGLGGEDGESGVRWNRNDTANEVINGINLILVYDEPSGAFKGTLENLNTKVASQVRVEVHVYNANGKSTEYGPTTPADMQPGKKRDVTLAAPNAGNFVTFAMHPEVGSSGGEGSGS